MNKHESTAPASDKITRRSFLKMSTAAVAAASLDPLGLRQAVAEVSGVKKPNIVFVFSDEHRWCSLPFTEMPQVKVPNMERLSRKGMRFDNCVSNSPICVPYRGMLITGQWPHQSSCVSNDYFGDGDVIGLNSPTIAHTFRDNGYVTGYVGKWHLKNYTVYNAGFDYFKHWLYGDEHWETKVRDVPSHEPFRIHKGYNAIGMTDQALEFISQNAGGENPFLLMLSLNPPHWRWDDAPQEFVDMYPQDRMDYRPNVAERYKSGRELLYYQHYHAHISAMDVQIGRVMDSLKEHGIEDNTVFIYTSDHGSSFGSNGVGSKANPYEEAARVPFMISWPGKVKPGRVADNNIGAIDMFPTLCGLAGIKVPQQCGGQDFSSVILGRPGPDPASQFLLVNNFKRNYYRTRLETASNSFYPFRGVRTKQYTYVVYADGEWMLYDNRNDPFQMKNLVNDPAYGDVKAELRRELDSWLAKAEDPYIPEKWRKLPLPQRIAKQNEYYSIIPFKKQWDQLKTEAISGYLAGDITPEQVRKLRAAADEIMDEDFFGMFRTLDNELNGRKKYSKMTPAAAGEALAAHKEKYARLLAKAVKAILQ